MPRTGYVLTKQTGGILIKNTSTALATAGLLAFAVFGLSGCSAAESTPAETPPADSSEQSGAEQTAELTEQTLWADLADFECAMWESDSYDFAASAAAMADVAEKYADTGIIDGLTVQVVGGAGADTVSLSDLLDVDNLRAVADSEQPVFTRDEVGPEYAALGQYCNSFSNAGVFTDEWLAEATTD